MSVFVFSFVFEARKTIVELSVCIAFPLLHVRGIEGRIIIDSVHSVRGDNSGTPAKLSVEPSYCYMFTDLRVCL